MPLRAAAEAFTTADAVRESGCSCITEVDPSDDVLEDLIDQASDELTRLSMGRVYGRREVTVRYCRDACYISCACGCGLDGLPLWGPDPVVSAVRIDDETLATSAYTIHEHRGGYFLVRTSSDGIRPPSWPSWQEMWRPLGQDNTFAVTYEYGVHVDRTIEQAAIELVCYYVSQLQKKRNQLPKGTVSASYNNVSLSLRERQLDPDGKGADGVAVGEKMSEFAAFWAGPRSTFWSPELDNGWSMVVAQ